MKDENKNILKAIIFLIKEYMSSNEINRRGEAEYPFINEENKEWVDEFLKENNIDFEYEETDDFRNLGMGDATFYKNFEGNKFVLLSHYYWHYYKLLLYEGK